MDIRYLTVLTEALNKTFAWYKYRETQNIQDPISVTFKMFYGKKTNDVTKLMENTFHMISHRNIAFLCQDKTYSTAIVKNRTGKYRVVRMPTTELTKFYEDLKSNK